MTIALYLTPLPLRLSSFISEQLKLFEDAKTIAATLIVHPIAPLLPPPQRPWSTRHFIERKEEVLKQESARTSVLPGSLPNIIHHSFIIIHHSSAHLLSSNFSVLSFKRVRNISSKYSLRASCFYYIPLDQWVKSILQMKQNAAIFQDPSSFYQQNLTLYASSSPLNFIENQKKISKIG